MVAFKGQIFLDIILDIGARYNDGNGNSSGHVLVFQYKKISESWHQLGTDIDGEYEEDFSGMSVSLSKKGNIVAVGAPYNDGNGMYSGHVRIFQYDTFNMNWQPMGQDIDGEFGGDISGSSVSLSLMMVTQ